MTTHVKILDHGYVELIETWGADERIVEAARMSTGGSFKGWGPKHRENCVPGMGGDYDNCSCGKSAPGDEKLLRYLYEHKHATPFEMAGMIIEVKAPIFVFREWMRHRTQSFNEMSARYAPLPDENYVPSVERLLMTSKDNKQAGIIKGAANLTPTSAACVQGIIAWVYAKAETAYRQALQQGVPKELARVVLPVGRYSKMRASASLRNWLAFLTLRMADDAQWEIRQYANAVASFVEQAFPKTYALFAESAPI